MRFFNKKKENTDDEIAAKDLTIKDLKPRNRRKRVEPPKPWGIFERTLIFVFLFGSVLISFVLALASSKGKLAGLPRISGDLSQEHTVLVPNSREDEFVDITKSLSEKISAHSGVYSIYVAHLSDNSFYGVNEHDVLQAASLIKLPVMVSMYMEAEAGRIALGTKYTLNDSDKIGGAGSLYYKPAGTVLTYRELLKLMGQQSDNTAFGIIKRVVGQEKIDLTMKKIGMSDTSVSENLTTAYDIGLLFQKIWGGNLILKENRDEMLEFLTDTAYENWLREGIPAEVRVAHKYGREVHVVNDAGIVFSKPPFVLVIMSDGVVEREADSLLPELARLVYEFEETQ